MSLISAHRQHVSSGGDRKAAEKSSSSFRSDSANLDLVRALAVLCVFFAHFVDIWIGRRTLWGWQIAQIGVSMFFVHTAMALMLSLERTRLQGRELFASFYLRRLFRLYPFSVVCVSIAMLFALSSTPGVPTIHWTWREYLANLTLTTNLTYSRNMVGGLWTLPIEVQMYILLPFLYVWLRVRSVWAVFALWIASVPFAMAQLHTCSRLSVIGFLPCFLAGVIAWKLSRQVERRFSGAFWPSAVLGVWLAFAPARQDTQMYFRWLFCLALGLAIPLFAELPGPALRRIAHHVAKYSYGIYLSHIAILLWVSALPAGWLARLVILVLLMVVVPVAAFHLIEQPMIRRGQRVAQRLFGGQSPRGDDASLVAPALVPGLMPATAKI